MNNEAPVYRKPLGTRRQVHAKIRIGDDAYDICYPSNGDRINVLAAGRQSGDIGPDNRPVDEVAGMRFLARVAVCVLFHPGGAKRVFADEDLEQVKTEPWLDEHSQAFSLAFAGPTVAEARGNSSPTPS